MGIRETEGTYKTFTSEFPGSGDIPYNPVPDHYYKKIRES
jgi:hypothetical protein